MKKHLNITITGSVQGVLFRVTTKEIADQLSITGFVRNLPNGDVFIEAEGEQSNLEKLIKWCHDGPELAKVVKVKIEELDSLKGFKEFALLRSADLAKINES